MLNHPTLDKLHSLKFIGMANAFAEQLNSTNIEALSFEERLGLLVDRELTVRDDRRMSSVGCDGQNCDTPAPVSKTSITATDEDLINHSSPRSPPANG